MYTRRNEQFNCDIRNNFYFHRVAKIWNELPHSVVTGFNRRYFKNYLDSDELSMIIDEFEKKKVSLDLFFSAILLIACISLTAICAANFTAYCE